MSLFLDNVLILRDVLVHCIIEKTLFNIWNNQIWKKGRRGLWWTILKILQFGQYVWAAEIWRQPTENGVTVQNMTRATIDILAPAAENEDQNHNCPRREMNDGRVSSLAWMMARWKPARELHLRNLIPGNWIEWCAEWISFTSGCGEGDSLKELGGLGL